MRKRWGCLAVFLLNATPVLAAGFPDVLEDPLLTLPPQLEAGPVLPGDERPLVCPSIDLSALTNAPISLADAVDLALCRNPQIRAAWAAIRVQAAALGEARAAYLPTLSASTSWLNNQVRYPDSALPESRNKGQTIYSSLNWRLFDFGGRAANNTSANRLLEAALASHDAALQKTLVSLVGVYFDAVAAVAQWEARMESTRLAGDTLAATERRARRGAAGQGDVLQAKAAFAKAQLAERRAAGDRHKGVAVLVQTMNLPPATTLTLAAGLEPAPFEAREDLGFWLAEATARHPGIRAARSQLDAAEAKVAAVRSDGLPTVDWSTNFYRNGYPNQGLQTTKSDTTTWGVTLNIPFFEGFSRTYKIRGAEAQVAQSAAQLADTERQILAEVVKAHADAVSALGNLESSRTLLDAASDSLASSERRYAKGAADILELLNQQSLLAEARQERVRCEAEWRSARFRLMAGAGVMGRLIVRLSALTERSAYYRLVGHRLESPRNQ